MRKWLKQALAFTVCLVGCAPVPRPMPAMAQWVAYYNNVLPTSAFEGLDLVVFDRLYHPDFEELKGKTVVLGYVTLGEIYGHAPEVKELEASKALLFHNKKFDSHAVDLRNPQWRALVMRDVDDVINQGFDGVFLDTVDSPLYWGLKQGPKEYEAMQQAALSLIHDIRLKYPDKKIMLNRGFEILAGASLDIDYVLAESILSHKDEFTGQFQLLPPKDYQDAVTKLHTIIARAGNIQVFTLDYWDMEDSDGVKRLYELQRASGFSPYVTSYDLKLYTPEPPEDEPQRAGN